MPDLARALVPDAKLFAALGDETRLRLVARLCDEGPMSIARLTTEAGKGVTRQAISKHLRTMEEAGLAAVEKRGRETLWAIRPKRLDAAREHLARISREWEGALDRLRLFVEEEEEADEGG